VVNLAGEWPDLFLRSVNQTSYRHAKWLLGNVSETTVLSSVTYGPLLTLTIMDCLTVGHGTSFSVLSRNIRLNILNANRSTTQHTV
jgi:hypothetical protein